LFLRPTQLLTGVLALFLRFSDFFLVRRISSQSIFFQGSHFRDGHRGPGARSLPVCAPLVCATPLLFLHDHGASEGESSCISFFPFFSLLARVPPPPTRALSTPIFCVNAPPFLLEGLFFFFSSSWRNSCRHPCSLQAHLGFCSICVGAPPLPEEPMNGTRTTHASASMNTSPVLPPSYPLQKTGRPSFLNYDSHSQAAQHPFSLRRPPSAHKNCPPRFQTGLFRDDRVIAYPPVNEALFYHISFSFSLAPFPFPFRLSRHALFLPNGRVFQEEPLGAGCLRLIASLPSSYGYLFSFLLRGSDRVTVIALFLALFPQKIRYFLLSPEFPEQRSLGFFSPFGSERTSAPSDLSAAP